MSNVAIIADSAIPPEGRRAKVRQPLGSLAYLDIVPDNGGIILNLSEDGLAFQAVGPLHDQKEVQLVIQLPHSAIRFETAAEIVWLGASSRQAGVRFLNMPADARLQIREWIESQNASAPHADIPASTDLGPVRAANRDETDSPSLQEHTGCDSRQQKWLSLISEFEDKFKQQEPELPIAEPEQRPENELESISPAAFDAPPVSPKPEILPWPSTLVSTHEQAPEATPIPTPELFGARLMSGDSPRERPHSDQTEVEVGRDPYLPTAASKKRGEPAPNALNPERAKARKVHSGLSALESEFTLLRTVVVQGSPPAKGNDQETEHPTRQRDSLRNQVALVVVFALFSVLCFGIGTWVGHLPSSDADPQDAANVSTPSRSDAPAQATAAHANPPGDRASVVRNNAGREKTPDRPTAIEAASPRRNVHSTEAPVAQSDLQASAIPSAQPSAPELSERAPQALSSARRHVSTAPANNAAAQLSPVDLSAQNPTPQVVNGYVLRPSDRFLPCHLTYRVDPIYPAAARQQGIEGAVKIHLAIGPDGAVRSETVISGPPELISAALEAAKYWRYLPALLNGQAVPTEKDVDIDFHLPH